MTRNTVILGTQWGDEGKGKLVDALADEFDVVARSAGGSNAGHTIVAHGTKYVFHLLPSGLLHPNTTGMVGNGCVVHVPDLMKEIDELEKTGLEIENRIKLSDKAHMLLDYHRVIDGRLEELRGDGKVGTTKQGIGPCYTDKAMRIGVRLGDLREPTVLREKIKTACEFHNQALDLHLDAEEEFKEVMFVQDRVLPLLDDTRLWLNEQMDKGKKVLFEGAQAHHLDIDHGTYPYVTSSSCTIGGVCAGSGVGPQKLERIIGIVKAYTTRVGEGPFRTELDDELGKKIQEIGGEFGATTGRPRRCGWLDADAVRESVVVNGITDVNLTKLDVLTGLSEIKVWFDGKYKTFKGWNEDITELRTFDELPKTAQKYVQAIEKMFGAKASSIGVGPDREALIFRNSYEYAN
jgi:adenylosuccinate synthase